MKFFNGFTEKFPQSKNLFLYNNPWFVIPTTPNSVEIVKKGLLHTLHFIENTKNLEPVFYSMWLNLTLKNGTKEDVEKLYLKKQ